MIPSGHATGSLRGVALGDESAAAVGTKPAAKSSRSCHRTCRRNLCEIEARPVEQRFAIAAACTDAEASNCAASTVINNSVHLWALELLTAFTQSVKAGTGSARSHLGTSAGV